MNLKIKRKTKRKNKQRIKRKTKRAFCSRRMFGGLNNASSLNKQLTQSLNTNLTEKLTETLYSIITTAELAYSKLQSTTQNALKNINLAMNFLDNQSEVIQKLERINKVLDNPIVKQQIIEFEKKIPTFFWLENKPTSSITLNENNLFKTPNKISSISMS
jgi:hypothetical protein